MNCKGCKCYKTLVNATIEWCSFFGKSLEDMEKEPDRYNLEDCSFDTRKRIVTVEDWINFLSQYPKDMQVSIMNFSPSETNRTDFKVVEEFPDGDPANPNCEYLKDVLVIGG